MNNKFLTCFYIFVCMRLPNFQIQADTYYIYILYRLSNDLIHLNLVLIFYVQRRLPKISKSPVEVLLKHNTIFVKISSWFFFY